MEPCRQSRTEGLAAYYTLHPVKGRCPNGTLRPRITVRSLLVRGKIGFSIKLFHLSSYAKVSRRFQLWQIRRSYEKRRRTSEDSAPRDTRGLHIIREDSYNSWLRKTLLTREFRVLCSGVVSYYTTVSTSYDESVLKLERISNMN